MFVYFMGCSYQPFLFQYFTSIEPSDADQIVEEVRRLLFSTVVCFSNLFFFLSLLLLLHKFVHFFNLRMLSANRVNFPILPPPPPPATHAPPSGTDLSNPAACSRAGIPG